MDRALQKGDGGGAEANCSRLCVPRYLGGRICQTGHLNVHTESLSDIVGPKKESGRGEKERIEIAEKGICIKYVKREHKILCNSRQLDLHFTII
jgi:hypothetical protein